MIFGARTRSSNHRFIAAVIGAIFFAAIFLLIAGREVSTRAQSETPQTIGVFDVLTASQITIQGASQDSHLGGNGSLADLTSSNRARAMAVGDVNGDGIPDLIIGAPDSTITVTPPTGPPQIRNGAGAVYVFFGHSNFTLPATFDTKAGAAMGPSLTILGASSGDNFGFSVAAGDVNGDGIDDLVVGSPGVSFNANSRQHTGAVFGIFGSHNFTNGAIIDLATQNAADLEIFGIVTGDLFGSSVAVGNVGGPVGASAADQAAKDILAGAPGFSGPGGARSSAGGAFVTFGGSRLNRVAGVTTVFDLNSGTTPPDVEILGRDPSDAMGTSTAIGNVNAAAIGSLIVGSPAANRPAGPSVPAANNTGAVYVVYGGANLNPATSLPKIIDTQSDQENDVIFGGASGDRAGASIAVGDVNGDGTADLVIGAPSAGGPLTGPARAQAGQVYVITGGARVLPASGFTERRIDIALAFAAPNDPANLVNLTLFGSASGDFFGSAVATGNYNIASFNSPLPSLLIGAPGFNGGAGEVSVIFGGATLLATNVRDLNLGQDDIRVRGAAGFGLGWAMAGTDINHDLSGDLIVAAPFATVTTASETRARAGSVFVLPGNVPATSQQINVTLTSPRGGETLQVGHTFNITWAASDPNGDGNITGFQIALSTDGGANFNFVVAANVPGTARSFNWTVPGGLTTTLGRIRVAASDSLGATGHDQSAGNFTITDVGVHVTLTSPVGGESLHFGQSFLISWFVAASDLPLVKGYDLFLSTDQGSTFPVHVTNSPDPTQPALGPSTFNFNWTVPSICTSLARIAVVVTSTTNIKTLNADLANFSITDVGPTIDTNAMDFPNETGRLVFRTTQPQSGAEVDFSANVIVEVQDAGGVFRTWDKPIKVKPSLTKIIVRGTISGQDPVAFFPVGATRMLRFTNPTCGITLFRVTHTGDSLVLATNE
jgi:hypothetical protein